MTIYENGTLLNFDKIKKESIHSIYVAGWLAGWLAGYIIRPKLFIIFHLSLFYVFTMLSIYAAFLPLLIIYMFSAILQF